MYEDEQDLNLPQVAPSHVRRKASENALRATLEPQFGIRLEREDDYGADGSIELRYPGSTGDRYLSSGRRAWFQLKSTAHDDPRYAMETKNINYLVQHVCPIYLLYLHATGQIYFRWLRDICAELDQNRPAWRTQDSVMVSFSRLLDPSAFAEIALE